MTKRFVSRKHLEFVGTKACCICGTFANIQVHHLLKPWEGMRRTGLKANDRNVIPLCMDHHHELHKRGNEEAFFEDQGLSNYFGKVHARMLWHQSPYHDAYRDAYDEHLLGWAETVLKEEEHESSD